ncbi:MAG: glycosyltransferase family 2 protein [Candidatus Omnitrophica bacterium]|nr:glycosyltransferase family 2 protein [Candidatus Omnitrophota bacterium]MDD5652570.1 glycosyltransferase family 2 protein [Candidatus Omnitrophota bacterium]
MNSTKIRRLLEIIPGFLSWGVIFFLIVLSAWQPAVCAVAIIVFDFYWIIRTLYLTTLLVMAHRRLFKERSRNWLKECQELEPQGSWLKFYHLVIFPVYKESPAILKASLEAIKNSNYPNDNLVVVVAFEERNRDCRANAKDLEDKFKGEFFGYLSTFHPNGLPGETPTKGANATFAAKAAKEFFDRKKIPYENIIVSCFDADTCVEKGYFSCLTHHFLTTPKPHQASYQPIPVYNNNIWYAPSFARLVELTASFCQLIESMRLEKFVTFSSHSMSFKTLVDIDYWPVNMISDDSVIYWKAFLFFKGNYRVVPLYITVSMDVAYSTNFFKTILLQYKQKRRWAWGVENFPFLVNGFLGEKDIPLFTKIRRSYHLLESHVTWAIWAVIIILMPTLPIILGGSFFAQTSAVGYNLPRITGLLFNFTAVASLIWIFLSRTTLPPRPRDVKWHKNILMLVEWIIVPFIVLILGSTPALDAQTRLMLGRYMVFETTEKKRK